MAEVDGRVVADEKGVGGRAGKMLGIGRYLTVMCLTGAGLVWYYNA